MAESVHILTPQEEQPHPEHWQLPPQELHPHGPISNRYWKMDLEEVCLMTSDAESLFR